MYAGAFCFTEQNYCKKLLRKKYPLLPCEYQFFVRSGRFWTRGSLYKMASSEREFSSRQSFSAQIVYQLKHGKRLLQDSRRP